MSRDKKRQMIWYQVDDSEAAARHLSKMARKGWFLEGVDNWYYTYRRGEPADVQYAVTFFPDASCFDPSEMMEGQKTYAEYCQAAGWELAASYGPIQYFRTSAPNPTPIETDETIKLASIRRTMRKTFVLTYAVLLLLSFIGLPFSLTQLQNQPTEFFSSCSSLSNFLIMTGILVYSLGMLLDYLIWLLRSRYAVSKGGACCKPHTRFRLALNVLMAVVCVIAVIGFMMESSWLRGVAVIYFVIYGGLILLSRWVLRRLKASNMDRGTIKGIYFTFAVIAGLVVGLGSAFMFIRLADAGIIHTGREPAETYVYTDADGSFRYPRDVFYDDLPITLETLGYHVTENDHCSYEETVRRSPLMVYSKYAQEALNFDSPLPDLFCQTFDSQWNWVLDRCWKYLVETGAARFEPRIMQNLDPSPWNALGACRQEGLNTYYLRYPNRIVTVHLDGEAAPQQLDAIIASLQP